MSSRELLRALHRLGFRVASMRGSHAKLRREVHGVRQILTVPVHAELAPGTLRAILRQLGRFVPEDELRRLFYR